MDSFIAEFQDVVAQMHANIPFVLSLLGIIWAIHIVNAILGYRLNLLGIYPRSVPGIFGIAFSPVLHGDFNHLFFNSVPLFVLANLVLLEGYEVFLCATLTIIVLSGLAVWLVGRKAIHIGASNLIMGYWSYSVAMAFKETTVIALIVGLISLYYFGGLFSDLFPLRG